MAMVPRRRIAVLWFPRLATDIICRARPALRDGPTVAIFRNGGKLAVVGVTRAAELAGVLPGQGLADARSLCPAVQAVETEPAALRSTLDRLARWCGRYTPWVGRDAAAGSFEGGLVLDISGCSHLFGGEHEFLKEIAEKLHRFGLEHHVAVADTGGAAWAWARFGAAARGTPVLAPQTQREALAPLPVAALRLPVEASEGLKRLGLHSIGDLSGLPPAALAARFGPLVRLRLDQALGTAPEPVAPLDPPPAYRVQHLFGEAVLSPEAVTGITGRLLATLARQLERNGLGARRLLLTLYRIDGTTATAEIGTSRPGRDPLHLARLFAPRLEEIDPDPGVEAITLAARAVEAFTPLQGHLHTPAAAQPAPSGREDAPDMTALIDRLAGSFGADRVLCAHPVETTLPEGQVRWRSRLHHPPGDWSGWPGALDAPVRLFSSPPSVKPSSTEEHRPPASALWRRHLHGFRPVGGPERRCAPWWTNATGGDPAASDAREYWTVEDEAGRRLWLARDRATGRWAVQGLMG